MPPRASTKRKSNASNSKPPAKSARTEPPATPASKKAASKEVERIDQLFDSYANKSLRMIDPEGIEALCSDLGVAHTDVRMLLLAWKLNAEKQGYFTEDEWQRGLKEIRADTIKKLKTRLSDLVKEIREPGKFEDFYLYAFQYCLTEDKQKCVDIDTACALLDIVIGSQFRAQVDSFTEYLKIQSEYKVINLDQWKSFHRFCNEISFPDLKGYDSSEAWPLIFDNFVEWLEEKSKLSSA
ncbi:hypothetical protein DCAR_0520503 [Daucus carota subsp. sativus]|uniref:Defective in cullin neddylation protein n=1 Tax=Daucus carota subsp. sativus TaxID=79200 RepID=A0A164YKK6_DAUCS|nr:PREDICTED: DCN1-like protein 4 [Daucus carota subsp. sativus]WOH01122.1 hypothetical protein DCAR_0520503 [Daucus carota subsp. sativus]